MIIASDTKLTPETYDTCPYIYDKDGVLHTNVRMYIVREATKEEWLADGGDTPLKVEGYYLVSID